MASPAPIEHPAPVDARSLRSQVLREQSWNVQVENSLSTYLEVVADAMQAVAAQRLRSERFEPEWAMPEMSSALESFFSASELRLSAMGEYSGARLHLLDLTRNPCTRTTKTFGSHVIVARALRHIETSREPVLLFTPSSANKAVALRDAVARAYEVGLATPETLRVATLVPKSSRAKLWSSRMSEDPELALRNPVAIFEGSDRGEVKRIAAGAVSQAADRIHSTTGFRVWHTLDPDNYRVADVVRACIEAAYFAPDIDAAARTRWHVHAVSSAYGFLGHDLGREVLGRQGKVVSDTRYLFVQHLETPDLVLAVLGRGRLPRYEYDDVGSVFRQTEGDPHFPATCLAENERLERTFWTREPTTIGPVLELVARQGGNGMVVSLEECLERYHQVRRMTATADLRLAADPRELLEWALVMAVVGALNAIDRGLLAVPADVVIHASGCYADADFDQLDRSACSTVASVDDMALLLSIAAATGSAPLDASGA
jgi:hypothetical protein